MSQRKHQRTNQRGSALLIVFVFAAFVAIALYKEMPVAIFEAQRDKEQLLIDRGKEYSQAVKIYLRKTGQYPATIDALENTNRVRYLRKKFKDPFTDKADWRLLHAGPNGMLIDSKIKLAQTVTGAGNSALGTFNTNGNNQSSPFGGTAPGNPGFGNSGVGNSGSGNSGFNNSGFNNSGFNNSGFNNNSGFSNSGFNNGASPGGNQGNFGGSAASRGAIANNQPSGQLSSPNGANNPMLQGGTVSNADGIDPNVLPAQRNQPLPVDPNSGLPQALTNNGVNGNPLNPQRSQIPNGTNGSAIGAAEPSPGTGSAVSGGFASSTGVSPGMQNAGNPGNPNAAVGGLFANPNQAMPQTNGFGNSTGPSAGFGSNSFNSSSGGNSGSPSAFGSPNSGGIQSGGLAGVASKAERHSIKMVNDQQNYSLWEFYYDPSKDPSRNAAGAAFTQSGTGMTPGNQPGNSMGQQNGMNNSQSNPFGSQNNGGGSNSGFGGFGNGLSGMGNGQAQGSRTQNTQGPNFGGQQPPSLPQQPQQ